MGHRSRSTVFIISEIFSLKVEDEKTTDFASIWGRVGLRHMLILLEFLSELDHFLTQCSPMFCA